jgi:hypothetical protein
MATQITDEHIATFATRIVLCNALGYEERFERYGEVARQMQR